MKRVVLIIIIAVWSINGFPQKPVFPLHASENGRYLVDSNSEPFFYQAETPWRIFINLSEKEMDELMDLRISQGFNVLQTMALTSGINVNGDKPFEEKDFTKPNLAYFEHIRKGIRLAGEKGLLVGMAPVWKGCCKTSGTLLFWKTERESAGNMDVFSENILPGVQIYSGYREAIMIPGRIPTITGK